jgi:molybdate transport system substrate-binding protein
MSRMLVLLALLAGGCNRGAEVPAAPAPVIAFVAASTKEAVGEVASAFTREHHAEVKINADDSSKLAVQIAESAPAQLFLSANEKWAEFVTQKGLAQQTTPLLGNTLVIVTPRGNPAHVRSAADLAKGSVKRLAVAGPTVPAGIYARQALRKLNVWEALEAGKKVVAGENVRVTLTYVERGEVDAGIVYATDARISDAVEVVYTFSADTHDPIRYPLVLLRSGAASPSARAFFDYLKSHAAKDVFAKHGFTLLDPQ